MTLNSTLIPAAVPLTMSSIELLAIINQARAEYNEPEVRRNQFNARVEDELEGTHYKKTVVTNENGTESVVFELNQDQCMLVSMRESKAVRRKVLDKLKSMGVPQTMAQALRLAADQAEQIEQQKAQLALAAPKVEYVDRYVAASGSMGFRQVAKLLQANEHEFRAWLQDEKIMYRLGGEWAAYQNHIDAGRFLVRSGVATANDHAFNTTKFTPKGTQWVAGLWGQHKARLAQEGGAA